MSVTLAMLVKDPPLDRLAALLDYVSPVVDQVVTVVDDRTSPSACFAMGSMTRGLEAEIVHFRWTDDFAEARNAALPACTGDWILHLDPDELPSAAMLDFIASVDRSEWRRGTEWQGGIYADPLGYLFWTRNYFDGRQAAELEEHWHCRLFRRELGRWYKPVHELVALEGRPESDTRETPLLPKAPRGAYLIHSRMNRSDIDAQYVAIGARNAV